MAACSLEIDRPVDNVWKQLQELPTWEGIGGLTDLRRAQHASDGALESFDFTIDTPLGEIRESAAVRSTDQHRAAQHRADQHGTAHDGAEREMHITGSAKGVTIAVDVDLGPSGDGDGTVIRFSIEAQAGSFLAKPLAATLNRVFQQNLEDERRKLARRLGRA